MKRTILILLLLLVAMPALAATKKCPPKCAHRSECASSNKSDQPRGPDGRFIARQPASAMPVLWDALVSGFELSAGFRWAPEHDCPTLEIPNPLEEPRDPFYIGGGLRLPLAERTVWHTQFDRDFTAESNWQLRTQITVNPFGGTP